MDNTLLSQIPVEKRKYIEDISSGPFFTGNMIVLKKGYHCGYHITRSPFWHPPYNAAHIIYRNTIEEVIKELDKVEKCNCDYCKGW